MESEQKDEQDAKGVKWTADDQGKRAARQSSRQSAGCPGDQGETHLGGTNTCRNTALQTVCERSGFQPKEWPLSSG